MQSAGGFAYGAFRLDPLAKRVFRDGSPVPLKRLQFAILDVLLGRPGELVTKDQLMQACWGRLVSEDSIVQAVSRLRRVPGIEELGAAIETVTRQGYRFEPGKVSEAAPASIERVAISLPHRAFMNGRAALFTLKTAAVEEAHTTFARLVEIYPLNARYLVGHANACALLHEARRTTPGGGAGLLRQAEQAARRARDLDPTFAEAWATFGFVLDRMRDTAGAVEALLQAVDLQRDNWRHWLRLAYASWGQPRIDAVMEVLRQMPGCVMAHCLAAMVWIARNSLDKAEQEIDLALAHLGDEGRATTTRLPLVAVYWIKGLLCLARGDVVQALAFFRREVALEAEGHLYGNECCANAWRAIGVCLMRLHDDEGAREAFAQALKRVPGQPLAELGLEMLDGVIGEGAAADFDPAGPMAGERLLAQAIRLSRAGNDAGAARLLGFALSLAPEGSTGWLIPIEPELRVQALPAVYAGVLQQLSHRAL